MNTIFQAVRKPRLISGSEEARFPKTDQNEKLLPSRTARCLELIVFFRSVPFLQNGRHSKRGCVPIDSHQSARTPNSHIYSQISVSFPRPVLECFEKTSLAPACLSAARSVPPSPTGSQASALSCVGRPSFPRQPILWSTRRGVLLDCDPYAGDTVQKAISVASYARVMYFRVAGRHSTLLVGGM